MAAIESGKLHDDKRKSVAEIERRYSELEKKARIVNEAMGVSNKEILHVFGLLSLVGVVLIGERYMGFLISHTGNPKELSELIELMLVDGKIEKGLIVAGPDNYAVNMKEEFGRQGVTLSGEYLDHVMSEARFDGYGIKGGIKGAFCDEFLKEGEAWRWSKDLLIVPETKEVLMFSDRSGYLKLN